MQLDVEITPEQEALFVDYRTAALTAAGGYAHLENYASLVDTALLQGIQSYEGEGTGPIWDHLRRVIKKFVANAARASERTPKGLFIFSHPSVVAAMAMLPDPLKEIAARRFILNQSDGVIRGWLQCSWQHYYLTVESIEKQLLEKPFPQV